MATQLLLTLGFQTEEKAVIRLVEWETQKTLRQLDYHSPVSAFLDRLRVHHPEKVPAEYITPKCKFSGGSFWGNHFYTCTFNEVVRVNLPEWSVDHYFTKKTFNDLHYVHVEASGIYVCNTGLDVVEHFDHDFNFIEMFPMMSENFQQKFPAGVDYRYEPKIIGRESHPNQILNHQGKLLVNCPVRRCLANLSDNKPVIEGFTEMFHDGILRNGHYYFSCIDSQIVVVSAETLKIVDQHDLRKFYGSNAPGWCRGLEVIDDFAFVGFSRLRMPSKPNYLKQALLGTKNLDSHVLCYDLKNRKILTDWVFGTEIIYGIYEYTADVGREKQNE